MPEMLSEGYGEDVGGMAKVFLTEDREPYDWSGIT